LAEAAPGDRLRGDLVLVKPLVQGGMGTVWLARDEGKQRDVAVKILSTSFEDDEVAIKRFAREADAVIAVQGEHIVQMLGYGVTDAGRPYLVMELLDGEDLEAYLSRTKKPLPPAEAAAVIEQIGKALQRAHDNNIVHRDIKPANIFLLPGARAKLLDFGFAKKIDRHAATQLTAQGKIVGTPNYMSPEQMTGAKLDRRTDVFSLGAVAYEAFTGTRPFPGASMRQVANSIEQGVAAPPSSLVPELPRALDAWFKKACAADPGDRFATADEMVAALRAVFAPPSTTPASGSSSKMIWIVLVVLAAAAVYWFYGRHGH
jgi:eukaryotic-like serine/threonine-protein kinase